MDSYHDPRVLVNFPGIGGRPGDLARHFPDDDSAITGGAKPARPDRVRKVEGHLGR